MTNIGEIIRYHRKIGNVHLTVFFKNHTFVIR